MQRGIREFGRFECEQQGICQMCQMSDGKLPGSDHHMEITSVPRQRPPRVESRGKGAVSIYTQEGAVALNFAAWERKYDQQAMVR